MTFPSSNTPNYIVYSGPRDYRGFERLDTAIWWQQQNGGMIYAPLSLQVVDFEPDGTMKRGEAPEAVVTIEPEPDRVEFVDSKPLGKYERGSGH